MRGIMLAILSLAFLRVAKAQELKLGGNPSIINKSAILELESTTRGFLLPRIPDTTASPLPASPDGMLIYYTVDSSVYIRKGGVWRRLSGGTVTSESASVPTGLIVTVTNPTTTPNIAITTTLNGPVRGNGSGFVTGNTNLATEVTGILPFTNGGTGLNALGTANQLLRVNAGGTTLEYFTPTYDTTNITNFSAKVRGLFAAGTGLSYNQASGTFANTGVISVNGNTGALTLDTTYIGSFSTKVRSLFSGTAPITYANGAIGITQANATTNGYLSSTDWNTFNNKAGAFTTGNLTETGSGILTITGGTGAVVGSGTTVQVKQASTTQNGFLSSTDFTTFNNKLSTVDTTNITNFNVKVRSLFSGTAPVTYANGAIGITQATTSTNGYLSSTDWNTFNNKLSTVDTTNIANFNVKVRSLFSGTAPITYVNGAIGITKASTTTNGYLSSADFTTFNNKAAAFTTGNLTETGSGILTITGGTGAVVGNGTTVQVKQASTIQNGFLSSTDFTTFNNKLSTVDTTNIATFSTKVRSLFSGTAPITYANGLIGITQATTSTNGYLSSTDWNTFNNKLSTVDTTNIATFSTKVRSLFSGTAPITYANGLIGITQATTTTNGYLSSADWNTFNSKAGAFTTGNLTETGSGILTITGGTGAVVGSGTTVQVKQASTLQNGFLSSTDFTTFNNKLSTVDTTNIATFSTKVRSLFSGTAPITYANGLIGITQATTSTNGYLSSTDWNTFNNKLSTVDTTNIATFSTKVRSLFSGTAPITYANGLIGITQANATTNGYLSSTDWNTFNSKAGAFTTGNLTETGSGILTITGGTGAVVGSGTTVQVKQASTTQNGFLSSTDFTTFNNKLSTVDTTNITNFSTKVRSLFSGTAPITYANGLIGITQATTSTNGYLSNTDWNTFNNKLSTVDTTNIATFSTKVRSLFSGTAPITYANGLIGITQATTSTNGYLSNTDWNTFNSKAGAFTTGNLTETGSGILTITGGTGAVVGSGTTVQVKQASTTQNGFLSSTDFTTFNNKLSTVDTTNIATFSTKVRSLFSGTAPITYANGLIGITQATTSTNGYLSNTDWNTFNNKLSTVDTTNIATFSTKVRSLFSGTAPITYANGLIGITQATTSTNGYLSSTDWNTFNNKLSTVDTTNISNFNVKVRSLFNAGAGITYANGTITNSLASTTWLYGGNAVPSNQNFGTTSAFDLPIVTSGVERMRILSTGNVGIGITAPASALSVNNQMEIRRSGTIAQMLFTNVSGTGTGDFRIGSDGNDIYWQSGGGRNLEMGAFWGTFITGDRQASSFPSLVNGTTGTSVTAFAGRAGSVPLAVLGVSGQTANLMEWRSSAATLNIMSPTGNLAIGATAFDPTNPEKVLINAGTTTSVNALYMKGSINSYFQSNIRNLSSGNLASSDMVATADNGTESTNFMDIGINGSGYVYQSGAAIETGKANDTYILGAGNDMYIVNNNASKSIIFLSGGTATTDESMRITAANRVGIATSTPTDTLTVGGPFRMGINGSRLNYIFKGTLTNPSSSNINGGGGVLDISGTLSFATTGATVSVSPGQALPNGVSIAYAWVSSNGVVTVHLVNASVSLIGIPITQTIPANAVFYVTVMQ